MKLIKLFLKKFGFLKDKEKTIIEKFGTFPDDSAKDVFEKCRPKFTRIGDFILDENESDLGEERRANNKNQFSDLSPQIEEGMYSYYVSDAGATTTTSNFISPWEPLPPLGKQKQTA